MCKTLEIMFLEISISAGDTALSRYLYMAKSELTYSDFHILIPTVNIILYLYKKYLLLKVKLVRYFPCNFNNKAKRTVK